MKEGDRVRAIRAIDGNEEVRGQIGTIMSPQMEEYYNVAFDNNIDGHDLDVGGGPQCKDGYGWCCYETDLERLVAYHYCNPLCKECMKEPRKVVEFF